MQRQTICFSENMLRKSKFFLPCFAILTTEQCVYYPKQSINTFCPLSVYVYKSHDLMFLLTLEYCQFAPTCQMGKLKYRLPLFLCTKAQPL